MTKRFPDSIANSKLEAAIHDHQELEAPPNSLAPHNKHHHRSVMGQATYLEVSWQVKADKEAQGSLHHPHKHSKMVLITCPNHLQVYKDLLHHSLHSQVAHIRLLLLQMVTHSRHNLPRRQVLANNAS